MHGEGWYTLLKASCCTSRCPRIEPTQWRHRERTLNEIHTHGSWKEHPPSFHEDRELETCRISQKSNAENRGNRMYCNNDTVIGFGTLSHTFNETHAFSTSRDMSYFSL